MSTRKIKNNNNDNSNTVDSKKTVKQVKVTGVRHTYKGIIPQTSIIDGYENIMGFVILLTMVFGGIVLVLFDKSIGGYSILIGSIVVELFYVIWNNSNKEKKSINN